MGGRSGRSIRPAGSWGDRGARPGAGWAEAATARPATASAILAVLGAMVLCFWEGEEGGWRWGWKKYCREERERGGMGT